MTADDLEVVAKIVMQAQAIAVNSMAEALGVVITRLAWRAGVHEDLRADLRFFVQAFAAEVEADKTEQLRMSMVNDVLKKVLFRLAEIPEPGAAADPTA